MSEGGGMHYGHQLGNPSCEDIGAFVAYRCPHIRTRKHVVFLYINILELCQSLDNMYSLNCSNV